MNTTTASAPSHSARDLPSIARWCERPGHRRGSHPALTRIWCTRGMRLLVAEDDRAVRTSLGRALALEGYDVVAVKDGAEALQRLSDDRARPRPARRLDAGGRRSHGDAGAPRRRQPRPHPDAHGPGRDRRPGRRPRRRCRRLPPQALRPRRAAGRIRALLRRAQPAAADGTTPPQLALADLRIDTGARRVWRSGSELDLTKTEYDLLELLVRNAGIVLDHSTIYERIWNYDFGPDSKNLAVYIGYLRRKTESDGSSRHPHRARSRLHRPIRPGSGRPMSLRWKIALAVALSPPPRRWWSALPGTGRRVTACTTRSTVRSSSSTSRAPRAVRRGERDR